MTDPKPLPFHHRAATDSEIPSSSNETHGISFTLPDDLPRGLNSHTKHGSISSYHSPLRHHQRAPSKSRNVKETLDARSHYGSMDDDDDGASVHRINQYHIKQEIGRGSFGAVHLAEDQYGNEFAIKEFSKSRLRKRAQSNLLRRPNAARKHTQSPAGVGFNSPLHRHSSDDQKGLDGGNNSLSLIKEEIAIMKKLNHNNVVSLFEVLDDPDEDSLYMVLEMCKKGIVMKVGIDEQAVPYGDEPCRCWFRDLILGIEYLHAQGIVHRDIKPDNCLITDDDVLKIVDFGVSEMFEKQSSMATAKSAGSPAFMPPELCVVRHGSVSGRAADIWSMGVTLYCLRYGRIPFEKTGMLDLYESIRSDEVPLNDEKDDNFRDLMLRLLCKDPAKRIDMTGIRNHPWVTRNGTDPLLSAEENCADIVEPPTEAEMDRAITGNTARLMAVMKAVKRFKDLLRPKRTQFMDSILGREGKIVAPPFSMGIEELHQSTASPSPIHKDDPFSGPRHSPAANGERGSGQQFLNDYKLEADPEPLAASEDVSRADGETEAHFKQRQETAAHPISSTSGPLDQREEKSGRTQSPLYDERAKGHAHDPMEDTLFLNIGSNDPQQEDTDFDEEEGVPPLVSESPPAVEMDIYELAYQEQMKQILERRQAPSMYLTRRVDHLMDLRNHSAILDFSKADVKNAIKSKFPSAAQGGLSNLVSRLQSNVSHQNSSSESSRTVSTSLQSEEFPGMPGGFPASPGPSSPPPE